MTLPMDDLENSPRLRPYYFPPSSPFPHTTACASTHTLLMGRSFFVVAPLTLPSAGTHCVPCLVWSSFRPPKCRNSPHATALFPTPPPPLLTRSCAISFASVSVAPITRSISSGYRVPLFLGTYPTVSPRCMAG